MVGVPRKNTCRTCRERKVKCDGRKPICKKCSRSARVCGGFEVEFLNTSARHYAHASPKQLRLSSLPSQSDAQVWDLFGLLLHECLPHPSQATAKVPLSWMRSVLSMNHSKLLSSAISTLTWGWYAHLDGRADWAIRSHQQYATTLGMLQKELSKIGTAATGNIELVVVVELLALYEIYEFGNQKSQAWLVHLAGAEKMLRLQHSENASDLYHEICLSHRLLSVTNALFTRKRSAWSTEERDHCRQTLHGGNKYYELLCIGADVAEFVEVVDTVSTSSTDMHMKSFYQCIVNRYVDLTHELETWRKILGRPLYPELPVRDPASYQLESQKHHRTMYPSKSPKQPALSFDQVQLARLSHLHSTILLETHVTMFNFDKWAKSSLPESSLPQLLEETLPERPHRISKARQLADDVIFLAQVCAQSAWQSFGSVMWTYSLKVAMNWYAFEEQNVESGLDRKGEQSRMHCSQLLARLQGERSASEEEAVDFLIIK